MTNILRWGILGTGNIARQFCAGVNHCRRGQLATVGSRQTATAQSFATEFHIPSSGSYEAVVSDSNVDAIYVALPNALHPEWTIKALRAGKHVLCEKPLALTVAHAQEMFEVATKAGRVLMEAFMYRTHPLFRAVTQSVQRGDIGQVRMIRTSFCFRTSKIEGNVRFNSHLGGGALADVGCYCINFSRFFAGSEPTRIDVTGRLHPTGVDEMAVSTMHFPNDILASFTCGLSVQADNSAYICGTDGYLEIPIPWKPPITGATFTLAQNFAPRMDSAGKKNPAPPPKRESHSIDAGVDLYGQEADEFAKIILDSTPPTISPADSLGNARVLEIMRHQLGLT